MCNARDLVAPALRFESPWEREVGLWQRDLGSLALTSRRLLTSTPAHQSPPKFVIDWAQLRPRSRPLSKLVHHPITGGSAQGQLVIHIETGSVKRGGVDLKDNQKLKAKLVDYVQDAHAMELNLELMLESMIKAAKDTKTKTMLETHLKQTYAHKNRLDRRLEALDSHPSIRKSGESVAVALPKGLIDRFRSDQPGKIARDGYVAEAVEIAAYSLLEQLALRCGDEATAEVARINRADEEEMAKKIAATWGDAIDMTLEHDGIAA